MNVDLRCVDRWSNYEKKWAIKNCREYMETRQMPLEYDFLCTDCLISDMVYEQSYCTCCHLDLPGSHTLNCWCELCQLLK